LTTRIAQDHPKNPVLLSDIQATYKWLDEHSEEARLSLLAAGTLKLFLNVNDPTVDEWIGQWETADNIMLNLHYDLGNVKAAKDFLLKYDKLLLTAGCGTMKILNRDGREPAPISSESDNQRLRAVRDEMRKPEELKVNQDGHEPAPNSSESDNQRLREVLNEMRKSGELIDAVLVPTFSSSDVSIGANDESDDEEVEYECNDGAGDSDVEPNNDVLEVNPSELGAHRVILAAAIPYLRDRATEWKKDSVVNEIYFYGSAFGAKLLLGTLPTPRPQDPRAETSYYLRLCLHRGLRFLIYFNN